MIVSEIKHYELLTLATKEDIARLDIKIAETKVDLIKWMVGFWIVQMAAIIGLYLNK